LLLAGRFQVAYEEISSRNLYYGKTLKEGHWRANIKKLVTKIDIYILFWVPKSYIPKRK
jgi:hypothetical protein